MRIRFPSPALVLLALVLVAGCQALGRARTHRVIVEGVVQAGDTYRVEPLETGLDDWKGPSVRAEIRIENVEGERVTTTCDDRGRFRVGPIDLAGRDDDRLTIVCPGTRSLCLSALLPPDVHDAPPGETVVVRWRITLPRRVARVASGSER